MNNFKVGYQSTEDKAILQELADRIAQINGLLNDLEVFAAKNELSIRADFGYGGRASFDLQMADRLDDYGVNYDRSQVKEDEYGDQVVYGWATSSMSC